MINSNAYYQYKNTSVQTASPERLLLMLYEGLLRFLGQALEALEARDYPEVNRLLRRSQDIIGELMATLNLDYEISHQLWALYDYFLQRLIEANVKKEPQPIIEVRDLLSGLQEAWIQAAGSLRPGRSRLERLNMQG
ncbi:MAG: flagellar export chaperone FliS [Syntrophomonadaceae bacterium]|nr:flagellar export chaperone FliS [Syntrophomonadaceae bacterium]